MSTFKRAIFLLKLLIMFPLNKYKGNSIHLSTRLSTNVKLSRTRIGRNCYIACNTVIVNTSIGAYCSIAPNVQIGGMEHSHWWLSTSTSLSDYCKQNNPVNIGNDVWIATGAVVKQGVRIGDGAVIGAMTFVNKDVPPNSIVIGVPGKILKRRFHNDYFRKLQATGYWNHPPKSARLILEKFEEQNPLLEKVEND